MFLSGAQFLFFGATLVLLTVLIFYSFPKTDAQDRLTGGGVSLFPHIIPYTPSAGLLPLCRHFM